MPLLTGNTSYKSLHSLREQGQMERDRLFQPFTGRMMEFYQFIPLSPETLIPVLGTFSGSHILCTFIFAQFLFTRCKFGFCYPSFPYSSQPGKSLLHLAIVASSIYDQIVSLFCAILLAYVR